MNPIVRTHFVGTPNDAVVKLPYIVRIMYPSYNALPNLLYSPDEFEQKTGVAISQIRARTNLALQRLSFHPERFETPNLVHHWINQTIPENETYYMHSGHGIAPYGEVPLEAFFSKADYANACASHFRGHRIERPFGSLFYMVSLSAKVPDIRKWANKALHEDERYETIERSKTLVEVFFSDHKHAVACEHHFKRS